MGLPSHGQVGNTIPRGANPFIFQLLAEDAFSPSFRLSHSLRIFEGKNDNDRAKTQCFRGKKIGNMQSIRFWTEWSGAEFRTDCLTAHKAPASEAGAPAALAASLH